MPSCWQLHKMWMHSCYHVPYLLRARRESWKHQQKEQACLYLPRVALAKCFWVMLPILSHGSRIYGITMFPEETFISLKFCWVIKTKSSHSNQKEFTDYVFLPLGSLATTIWRVIIMNTESHCLFLHHNSIIKSH